MKGQKKDKGALSPCDAEVRRYVEMTKDILDVRQEKVEAIKKRIESGTYDVSAESVAESILDLCRSLKSDEPSTPQIEKPDDQTKGNGRKDGKRK